MKNLYYNICYFNKKQGYICDQVQVKLSDDIILHVPDSIFPEIKVDSLLLWRCTSHAHRQIRNAFKEIRKDEKH